MADWTQDEIDAAVEAYVYMYGEERAGREYNKAATNRRYREGRLAGRSKGSFERRMQNITAVLMRNFGVRGIIGYVPMDQTGVGRGGMIRDALLRQMPELAPTTNPAELEARSAIVREQMRATDTADVPPAGNRTPARRNAASVTYARDPEVHAWVLENAAGHCECCGRPAPFLGADGLPFLEVHHVKRLASQGPDVIENTVAVCPNCHRESHLCHDPNAWADAIRVKVGRLVAYE